MDNSEFDHFEPLIKIVVIGVGGAGNNAVNHMIDERIENVEFYALNTDKQALATSRAPHRRVLGEEVTKGLGAGGDPAIGRKAAEASREMIHEIVHGASLVFIAAGMGGGTGTGAAPIIASIAKEEGALTIAIVTRPFNFEGKKRNANSVAGLSDLKEAVDSLIIVSNDQLLAVSGNRPAMDAFAEADRVLTRSVRTVCELVLLPEIVNLDFADLTATLKGAGICLIGYGEGHGENKAMEAAENAISSPLAEASICGARRAICAVTCGAGVTLYEARECVRRITEAAGNNIDIKLGVTFNSALDGLVCSVIASDFSEEFDFTSVPSVDIPSRENVGDGVKPIHIEGNASGTPDDRAVVSSILPDFLKFGEE